MKKAKKDILYIRVYGKEKLQKERKKKGVTMSAYMQVVIDNHLNKLKNDNSK